MASEDSDVSSEEERMYAEALVASQSELSPIASKDCDWKEVVSEVVVAKATNAASAVLSKAVLGLEIVIEAVDGRRKANRRAKRLRHRANLVAQLGSRGKGSPRTLKPLQHSGYRDESNYAWAYEKDSSPPPSPLLATWLLKATTPPLHQAKDLNQTSSLPRGTRTRLPIVVEVSSFLTGRVRVAWSAPSARVGWPTGAFEVVVEVLAIDNANKNTTSGVTAVVEKRAVVVVDGRASSATFNRLPRGRCCRAIVRRLERPMLLPPEAAKTESTTITTNQQSGHSSAAQRNISHHSGARLTPEEEREVEKLGPYAASKARAAKVATAAAAARASIPESTSVRSNINISSANTANNSSSASPVASTWTMVQASAPVAFVSTAVPRLEWLPPSGLYAPGPVAVMLLWEDCPGVHGWEVECCDFTDYSSSSSSSHPRRRRAGDPHDPWPWRLAFSTEWNQNTPAAAGMHSSRSHSSSSNGSSTGRSRSGSSSGVSTDSQRPLNSEIASSFRREGGTCRVKVEITAAPRVHTAVAASTHYDAPGAGGTGGGAKSVKDGVSGHNSYSGVTYEEVLEAPPEYAVFAFRLRALVTVPPQLATAAQAPASLPWASENDDSSSNASDHTENNDEGSDVGSRSSEGSNNSNGIGSSSHTNTSSSSSSSKKHNHGNGNNNSSHSLWRSLPTHSLALCADPNGPLPRRKLRDVPKSRAVRGDLGLAAVIAAGGRLGARAAMEMATGAAAGGAAGAVIDVSAAAAAAALGRLGQHLRSSDAAANHSWLSKSKHAKWLDEGLDLGAGHASRGVGVDALIDDCGVAAKHEELSVTDRELVLATCQADGVEAARRALLAVVHRSSPAPPSQPASGHHHRGSRSTGASREASYLAEDSEEDGSNRSLRFVGRGGSLLEEAIAAERQAALVAAQTAEAQAQASLAAAHAAAQAAQAALSAAVEKTRRERLEAFDARPQCWSSISSSSRRATDPRAPLPSPPQFQPPPVSPPCALIPDFDDLDASDGESGVSERGQLVEVWPLPRNEHFSSAAHRHSSTLSSAAEDDIEEEDFGALAEGGDWFRAVSVWLKLTLPGAVVERAWRNERPQLFRRYAEARRAVASEVRARKEASCRAADFSPGEVAGNSAGTTVPSHDSTRRRRRATGANRLDEGSSKSQDMDDGSSHLGTPPMGGWFTGCARDASGCGEKWLWHGTSRTDPRIICAEGLDFRLSSEHGLWGRASYLAVKASYSDRNQYAYVCPPATARNTSAGGRSGASSSSSSISTGGPRGLVGGLSGLNSAMSLSGSSSSSSSPSDHLLGGAKELILCWAAIGRAEELGTTPKQAIARPNKGFDSVSAVAGVPPLKDSPVHMVYDRHEVYPAFVIRYRVPLSFP